LHSRRRLEERESKVFFFEEKKREAFSCSLLLAFRYAGQRRV